LFLDKERMMDNVQKHNICISVLLNGASLGLMKWSSKAQNLNLVETDRGEILWLEIHKLINSVWSKEELPDQWKKYQFTRRMIKPIVVITKEYYCYQIQHFIQYPSLKVKSICRCNYWRSSVWVSM
jgi:hypothetical protein